MEVRARGTEPKNEFIRIFGEYRREECEAKAERDSPLPHHKQRPEARGRY